MQKTLPLLVFMGLLVAASTARADAPQVVPVQGVLTDTMGNPIDTSVTTVFSIYTSEIGGTPLWTEEQDVLVEDGLFTAYMGDETALDLATFRDYGDLWLGIRVGSDAEMNRMYMGSSPFAGYAEYCGNHPTPDFSDITGTLDPSDLPASFVSGPLSCSGTQKVSGVDGSGALVCAADTDTTYSAGAGLSLTGTTFSANTSVLQARVNSSCPVGQSIRQIFIDGTVVCEIDDDTNTTYSAGSGLTLSGTTFSVNTGTIQARVSGSCATGSSIRAISSTGAVTCETDDTATYSAGTGLNLVGTTFSVDPTDFNGSQPINDYSTTSALTTTATTYSTLAQISFTPPVNGHVLIMGTADSWCTDCTTGSTGFNRFGISSTAASTPSLRYVYNSFQIGDDDYGANHPTVFYEQAVTASTAYTWYLTANSDGVQSIRFDNRHMAYVFMPD